MPTTTTVATLSKSQLLELMVDARTTSYKPTIIKFVQSEELYLDCMTLVDFSGKKIDSVYNSFNNNLKALKIENPEWPNIQVYKKESQVLLVNITLLQGGDEEE